MDLVDLGLDLFRAAQTAASGDGRAWESAAVSCVVGHGARPESVPGGARLYGFRSASWLAHQLDAVVALDGVDVILELKAHGKALPKNDLLRFKAATDDFYVGLGRDLPRRPIYRLFAGLGVASMGMRRYAALHGIAMVERDRWPSIVLASPKVLGPADRPSCPEQRALACLVRPMQVVLRPSGGGYVVGPGLADRALDATLDLQDIWSERSWASIDLEMAGRAVKPVVLAA